jgi:hypothetical protein
MKDQLPAYGDMWNEGDYAMVTTRSGVEHIAVYTLAPGIDYYWRSLLKPQKNGLTDPDVSARRATEREVADALIEVKKNEQYDAILSTTDETTYQPLVTLTLTDDEEGVLMCAIDNLQPDDDYGPAIRAVQAILTDRLANAWDKAYKAGMADYDDRMDDRMPNYTPNPYRKES